MSTKQHASVAPSNSDTKGHLIKRLMAVEFKCSRVVVPIQLVCRLALATAAVFAEYVPLYSQIHCNTSTKLIIMITVTSTLVTRTKHERAPSYCIIATQISHMSKHHQTQGLRQFEF